jgi:molecular chaperone GrpE
VSEGKQKDQQIVENESGAGGDAVAEAATAADSAADGEALAPPTLEEQLAAAEAQAAEYLEGWKRARAEFDNARKRMERQRLEARTAATIDVVRKILPVIDDFERAIQNVPDELAGHTWVEGMTLVERKLRNTLDSFNVEQIATVGEPFDPNYHEAIIQEPSDEYESGVVIREMQAGYKLRDRVIRAALVAVAA